MNLLELQVLAVVSRIPDGTDAASLEFMFEAAPAAREAAADVTAKVGASPAAARDAIVGEPQA